jgi:hypothetical protein
LVDADVTNNAVVTIDKGATALIAGGATIIIDPLTTTIPLTGAANPLLAVGQYVGGSAGISPGTKIASLPSSTSIELSYKVIGDVSGTLTFQGAAFTVVGTAATNDVTVTLTPPTNPTDMDVAVGNSVSGTGIDAATFVDAVSANGLVVTLSKKTTQSISGGTLTFAEYQEVLPGQSVSGPGIRDGTRVVDVNWATKVVGLSQSTASSISIPANSQLTFGEYEEVLIDYGIDAVDVTRVGPTQAMGYTWSVTFTNKTVGGDQQLLSSSCSTLAGVGADISFEEVEPGNQLLGTFMLTYEGAVTPGLSYDTDAATVESAMNALHTIYPSKVVVTRTPALADDATQVRGFTWSITFTSNTWHDPTDHDPAAPYVPGNWQGESVPYDATWLNHGAGSYSRAWGKNVGKLNLIGCSYDGLATSRGDGSEKCTVLETATGTNPLGGTFRVGVDSRGCATMSDTALRNS